MLAAVTASRGSRRFRRSRVPYAGKLRPVAEIEPSRPCCPVVLGAGARDPIPGDSDGAEPGAGKALPAVMNRLLDGDALTRAEPSRNADRDRCGRVRVV